MAKLLLLRSCVWGAMTKSGNLTSPSPRLARHTPKHEINSIITSNSILGTFCKGEPSDYKSSTFSSVFLRCLRSLQPEIRINKSHICHIVRYFLRKSLNPAPNTRRDVIEGHARTCVEIDPGASYVCECLYSVLALRLAPSLVPCQCGCLIVFEQACTPCCVAPVSLVVYSPTSLSPPPSLLPGR